MSSKKIDIIESLVFILTFIIVIVGVNYMIFDRWLPSIKGDSSRPNHQAPSVKVEEIGNSVLLRYTSPKQSYYVEGVETNNQFVKAEGLLVFQNPDYYVAKDGTPYNIVNSSGEVVGSVSLKRADEIEHSYMEVDAATYTESFVKIPSTCTKFRVYTSVIQGEQPLSILVEERETPLDIIFDNVSLTAPDMSPAFYSVSDAPINMTVRGNVALIGGKNPYNANDISNADRFFDTLDTAGNAYCVVMATAIAGAASIYKGTEYYADMFKGISGLQLLTMENAWGKVEGLINGENGATGLDGIPAVQIMGDLNIIGENVPYLVLRGGQGGKGGPGSDGLINTTTGGRGGNGGAGLICNRLVNGIGDAVFVESGAGGEGGEGGKNIVGEQGGYGRYGESSDSKVIISKTEITLNK